MKLRRSAVPYRDQVTEPPRIDPDAPKLVYVQVADHITARIEAGDLAPGGRLPAERDLATEYGVSYDTIRRATALLRDRGLIITIVGRGTYVTPADQRGQRIHAGAVCERALTGGDVLALAAPGLQGGGL